jgi:hypothetical protein
METTMANVPDNDVRTRLRHAVYTVRTLDLTDYSRSAGNGWDPARRTAAEAGYRRFLALKYVCPTASLRPSDDVDEIWHQHILNTRQYAKDCSGLFGGFLHHQPEKQRPDDGPVSADATTSPLFADALWDVLAAGGSPTEGCSDDGIQVRGCSDDGIQVRGCSDDGIQVRGCSDDGIQTPIPSQNSISDFRMRNILVTTA